LILRCPAPSRNHPCPSGGSPCLREIRHNRIEVCKKWNDVDVKCRREMLPPNALIYSTYTMCKWYHDATLKCHQNVILNGVKVLSRMPSICHPECHQNEMTLT
jgi:hypothetical protein